MTADWEQIARLHAQGKTAREIAQDVGCSRRTVQRWRDREGSKFPVGEFASRPISGERLTAARLMVEDGASVNEICRTLHMHQQTIRRYFPEAVWSRQQAAEFAATVRKFSKVNQPRSGRREA